MIDQEVRLHVYDRFLGDGSPPTYAETALALDCPIEEAEASYRRLGDQHVLVFSPGTLDVWMANPLSAYPTPYWVETPRGSYWGNCIWDAFGVVAMLGGTGIVSTTCQDCGEAMELRGRGRYARPGRRRRAFRRSGPSVVGEHRLHMSDDARLPVGGARRALVRAAPTLRR